MLTKHLPTAFALTLVTVACGDDGGGDGSATDSNPTASTAPTTMTMSTTDPSGTTGGETEAEAEAEAEAESDTTTTDPTATTDPTTGPDTDTNPTESDTDPPKGAVVYFRLNTVQVRDPHFFAPLLGDVTNSNVNDPLTAALGEDDPDDPDGFLDLGFVLEFDPLDQSDAATGSFSYYNAQCTAPVETTTCDILPASVEYPSDYTSMVAGDCYAPTPANVSTYPDPPVAPEATSGPCFSTTASTVSIQTETFTLPIEDATVAAQYVGDPAGNLVSGNIEGFVSAAVAAVTMVDTQSILGVVALDTLLQTEDMDGDGWMFHIAFTAEPVEWTGA